MHTRHLHHKENGSSAHNPNKIMVNVIKSSTYELNKALEDLKVKIEILSSIKHKQPDEAAEH